MGKTKDTKAKFGTKLPKRIGGVKLTKEIRKAGGKLLEKANSPLGRELIAAGLSLAATAAAAAAEREREKRAADRAKAVDADVPAPADGAAKKPVAGGTDPHEMGVVLGRMAQTALDGLFAGKKG